MRKNIILFFSLIAISCGEVDFCSYINEVQEADFLMIKLIDSESGNDLLFGENKEINLSTIDVLAKSNSGDYTPTFFDFTKNEEDSILLISVRDQSTFPSSSLENEIVINYGNSFQPDTIKLQYTVAGYCENQPILYDYNVIVDDENICFLCFRDIIEIQK